MAKLFGPLHITTSYGNMQHMENEQLDASDKCKRHKHMRTTCWKVFLWNEKNNLICVSGGGSQVIRDNVCSVF